MASTATPGSEQLHTQHPSPHAHDNSIYVEMQHGIQLQSLATSQQTPQPSSNLASALPTKTSLVEDQRATRDVVILVPGLPFVPNKSLLHVDPLLMIAVSIFATALQILGQPNFQPVFRNRALAAPAIYCFVVSVVASIVVIMLYLMSVLFPTATKDSRFWRSGMLTAVAVAVATSGLELTLWFTDLLHS